MNNIKRHFIVMVTFEKWDGDYSNGGDFITHASSYSELYDIMDFFKLHALMHFRGGRVNNRTIPRFFSMKILRVSANEPIPTDRFVTDTGTIHFPSQRAIDSIYYSVGFYAFRGERGKFGIGDGLYINHKDVYSGDGVYYGRGYDEIPYIYFDKLCNFIKQRYLKGT